MPKAANEVAVSSSLFSNEDDAMVTLGVGKNMVRSIRFWAEAACIIEPCEDGYRLTQFGQSLLLGKGHKAPLDPFIEDIKTLWLIHWNLSTNPYFRIFAWDFFVNRWQEPEISASSAIKAMRRIVSGESIRISDTVLDQQYDIFLHSYVPTIGRRTEVREDNLDCPLVELGLLRQIGLRQSSTRSGPEAIYAFRRERKNEIAPSLFIYCLDQYWRHWHSKERTLALNLVVNAPYSPGQVFKLPEDDLRARCESLQVDSGGYFVFQESALQPVIVRDEEEATPINLSSAYSRIILK
ncbi:MAG: DUF4007 family protein [Acidobacteria bacterium]|nr:DUF4007 family protein [Acidobacteriota bacterium]